VLSKKFDEAFKRATDESALPLVAWIREIHSAPAETKVRAQGLP